jgi:membrane fusion protein (multidrug efflux system)
VSRVRPALWLILLVAVLGGVGVWHLTTSGSKGNSKKARIITVGVAQPLRQDYAVKLSYTADIKPYQQVNIFPRVNGYISRIHVEQGDLVKAGQLLVEIDHAEFTQQVAQARANLAAARANVVRQQATLANAKLALERAETLIKEQLVAQQQVDDAKAAYDVAQAQLEALRAQVQQAEVALQQAALNLEWSYLRAPFAGVIARRNQDVGTYFNTFAASSPTGVAPLLLHDIHAVRIFIEVVEKDTPLVKVGAPAEVTTDAYPGRVFTGAVSRFVQALDPTTRTMTVEVELPNPERILKGGMFARVDLKVGTRPNAILIPWDALTRLEDRQYVYVVRDGKAVNVPVEVGGRLEALVEITKGLWGDEQVIISGKDLVSNGVAVQAVPAVWPGPGG